MRLASTSTVKGAVPLRIEAIDLHFSLNVKFTYIVSIGYPQWIDTIDNLFHFSLFQRSFFCAPEMAQEQNGSRFRTAGDLFSPVVMGVIAIANDGVQKRAQDGHSALDKEERLNPKARTLAENADEDGNCDWKYHEQPM